MVKMQQNDMHIRICCMALCRFTESKAQQAPRETPTRQGMIIVGVAAFKRTEARGFVGIMQVFWNSVPAGQAGQMLAMGHRTGKYQRTIAPSQWP